MAYLRQGRQNGNWFVGFRYNGIEFCRSSRTKDKKVAERLRATVEETLSMLRTGRLRMPPDAERGAWILSGGSSIQNRPPMTNRNQNVSIQSVTST